MIRLVRPKLILLELIPTTRFGADLIAPWLYSAIAFTFICSAVLNAWLEDVLNHEQGLHNATGTCFSFESRSVSSSCFERPLVVGESIVKLRVLRFATFQSEPSSRNITGCWHPLLTFTCTLTHLPLNNNCHVRSVRALLTIQRAPSSTFNVRHG